MMRSKRGAGVLVSLALAATSTPATAQHSPAWSDSARAQIQSTLRAFYFNLGRHDWEALTADILAAKVIAHRVAPAPQALVIPPSSLPRACSSPAPAQVDQSTLRLSGDWAEVSVPRCAAAASGTDEFRLINFDRRWRIVYIDLFEEGVRDTGTAPN